MKLAEALSERSRLINNFHQLRDRFRDNMKVVEGEEPTEYPKELVKELQDTTEQLKRLIYNINVTNTRTLVDGKSITEMLAERDAVSKQVGVLDSALDDLTERTVRSRSDIRIVRTVDPVEFRKIHDSVASHLRKLDLRIQSVSWNVDLIEEL